MLLKKDAGFTFRADRNRGCCQRGALPGPSGNQNDKFENVRRLDVISGCFGSHGRGLKHADRFVINKRRIGEREGRSAAVAWRVEGRKREREREREREGDSSGIVNLTFPQPLPTLPAHS